IVGEKRPGLAVERAIRLNRTGASETAYRRRGLETESRRGRLAQAVRNARGRVSQYLGPVARECSGQRRRTPRKAGPAAAKIARPRQCGESSFLNAACIPDFLASVSPAEIRSDST